MGSGKGWCLILKNFIIYCESPFFELLNYKAENAGRKLLKVNPRGTSQKCSNSACGEIVPKTLAERLHH